jgi:ABC-type nitrate/sulfonate/bicarbonate transport system ATPase subunit
MVEWIEGAIGGYIGQRAVVDGVSLPIFPHKVTAIFGPSGSGKTSLLRIIAGLWEGRTVGLKINRNLRVGYVAQKDFLFPWMTLARNMLFPARLTNVSMKNAGEKVENLSSLFRIEHLLDRLPYEVSGGELQRALIVRALVTDPNLLLLDEPMNSLDVASRIALRQSLKSTVESENLSLILVTHELPDAISIANFICICCGPPLRVRKILVRSGDAQFRDEDRNLSAEETRLLVEGELTTFSS